MKNRDNGVPTPTKGVVSGGPRQGPAYAYKPPEVAADPNWRKGSTNAHQGPNRLEQQTDTGLPGRTRMMAQILKNQQDNQPMSFPVASSAPYVPYQTSPITNGGFPNYPGIGQLPPGFIPKPSPI